MKLLVNQTVTRQKEINIKFPFFCKNQSHYYKVFSENNSIQVFWPDMDDFYHGEISFVSTSIALSEFEEIEESEFVKAFNSQLKLFKSI